MPQPAALWPSPRNVLRQRLTIFSSECYQIVIAIHFKGLPRRDGRQSWPEHHECKQLAQSYYSKAVLVGHLSET